ncbi:MAG: AmmeMemoRadiSam system radical SAM enzyme [Bacteroidales bacterium]|nr:AmmeMemoRadiSam system radical SAM enzyme [Bacteroidales bacterium]
MFYSDTPRGVKCGICPNECTLRPGEISDCRNRINHEGKLYSIAYGNPCAVHVDPIEKKPLLHFYPKSKAFSIATAGCNFVCLNCQNWEISQTSPKKTRNYDLMPEKVVDSCKKYGCDSIAYTYGEPISFYEYMYDTSRIAHQSGIKNVMVSNGYINQEPLKKLIPFLDAANIDLKSFSNDIYLKLNAGKLQPVLDTLIALKNNNVWVEITNLVVPSWTDDYDMIKRMCAWLVSNGFGEYPLHFSRFHPVFKLTQLPETPLHTLIKAREIALKEGCKYVYVGNVPGKGMENTICPNCNEIVVERRGYTILNYNIIDGKCSHCKTKINGVWN